LLLNCSSLILQLSRHAPHKIKAEGYVFVPAGSRYITLNCRRLTLQSGRNVWKIDHPKGKGIQVPKELYETVIANEAATRTQRSAIVAKIDKKENDEALKCLLKLFPNLPPGASDEILQRAWQKVIISSPSSQTSGVQQRKDRF
jgi:hypothetical protein